MQWKLEEEVEWKLERVVGVGGKWRLWSWGGSGWTGWWWLSRCSRGRAGPGGGVWLRIPLSHGVGVQEVVSLQGLIIEVLVGDRALAGEVLPRFAKGTRPLLGSALHRPVPHLPR